MEEKTTAYKIKYGRRIPLKNIGIAVEKDGSKKITGCAVYDYPLFLPNYGFSKIFHAVISDFRNTKKRE